MSSSAQARTSLEREVTARLAHLSAESVRTTCSFAQAERLLGGEYHGRFLIELLQNAADAWRNDPRSTDAHSKVAVLITSDPEPALLVANQGAPLTPEVVIGSLGHIGASTKAEGESIGHKGIGFKSVLEITSRPEIYSGLQEPEPVLAVRFDPESALERIRELSPEWDDLVAQAQGVDEDDPLSPVPVLRYPFWVNPLPDDIRDLRDRAFDTVVRLPFDVGLAERHGVGDQEWLDGVRRSLDDLTDQVLLLLGSFHTVEVEDRISGESWIISPKWSDDLPAVEGTTGRRAVVERTAAEPAHWWIYQREIPGEHDLAGEIAVGMRLSHGSPGAAVLPAVDGVGSAPFHLFFPTRISSGLPFLLHGYFRVDASRTGFHGGSRRSNVRVLNELALLVRDVVLELGKEERIDLSSLVNLVAGCPGPEEPLAADFRAQVLGLLDDVPWVPARSCGGSVVGHRPAQHFVDNARLIGMVADVFPPDYVRAMTGLVLPHVDVDDRAIEFVASRQPEPPDRWSVLDRLFRPGAAEPWSQDEADDQFRRLLRLVNWLAGEQPEETDDFFSRLRGDDTSRLLPVVDDADGRRLLPLPDPAEGLAGRRSQLVMARVRSRGGPALVPPSELDVAFLPDGLLSTEEVQQARRLGVRQFTVDNVLDRLNGAGATTEDPARLLGFIWAFLARERRSQYGTRKSAERATVFDPADWFWCRPGRARAGDTPRLEQQRERFLADVLLPNRNGQWRPAGTLAFGADWADWVEEHHLGVPRGAIEARVTAYRALEGVCPDPGEHLLGPPEAVLPHLQPVETVTTAPASEDDLALEEDSEEEALDPASWDRERHAFLLRLGVWEVLPVEAYENRERRAAPDRFPWAGSTGEEQQARCTRAGGWTFATEGWRGTQHHDVHVGEDFRFRWSLADCARHDPVGVTTLLNRGLALYRHRLKATMFCPGCTDTGRHSATRWSTADDDYPSWLAVELQTQPWVPAQVGNRPEAEPVAPARAWWLEKVPSGPARMTSPWRFVPTCSPRSGIGEDLRRVASINAVTDATPEAVSELLQRVRDELEAGSIELARPVDRRSFISLHTLLYELLAEHPDSGTGILDERGVLCQLGGSTVYSTREQARHDDGTYSAYLRHFAHQVPLCVLPRDRGRTAKSLGIQSLRVDLRREGDAEGEDVTEELGWLLGDRRAELMAILVHHSLGTQTLTSGSEEFTRRSQRLARMRVVRLDELVVRATVEGVPGSVVLGERESGDVYLQDSTSGRPVLFHDFRGDGWQDRLQRRIAPHLATVLEAEAYAHTIALFLQQEGPAEREEFLLELGITADDVEEVELQLDLVAGTERDEHRRWFAAVLAVLGKPPSLDDRAKQDLEGSLLEADLGSDVAQALERAGGGGAVRRDTTPGAPLRLLREHGVLLQDLHDELRRLDPRDGLVVSDTQTTWDRWMLTHRRRVLAVRARQVPDTRARAEVDALAPPESLRWEIAPELRAVLAPVATLLGVSGHEILDGLASEPADTLTRLGSFDSVAELDRAALALSDPGEQARLLKGKAARWRRRLQKLVVLLQMQDNESRSGIRDLDDRVRQHLPADVDQPSQLVGPAEELLADRADVREQVVPLLTDDVFTTEPSDDVVEDWAREAGIDDDRISRYEKAVRQGRSQQTARLRSRVRELREHEVGVVPPAGLLAAPDVFPAARERAPDGTDHAAAPIKVARIKVNPVSDQRKRAMGDEGEQWALAAVVSTFQAMGSDERVAAVEDAVKLLQAFDTPLVDELKGRAADVIGRLDLDQDEEDLIEALRPLVHLSAVSDGFGFDLVGWVAASEGQPFRATCLEVKSTKGFNLHLSSNEWRVAEQLHQQGRGDRFAILAVRRGPGGGVPVAMDLLVDPVGLHDKGLLRLSNDGYVARYTVSD